MLKFFYRFLIDLTNNLYLSNLIRFYTTSKISRYLIPSFAKVFNINQSEMEKDIEHYKSLHEFFIRTLKKDTRPINNEPDSVISPVDGFIEDIGMITKQKDIIVKGQTFSIREMIGNDQIFDKYYNGMYVIIYLSPKDYHRIHSPITGKVLSQWELGNKSYPVNRWGLKYGKEPLAKNYRMLSEVKFGENRHLIIAKVGALFINSITLTHQNENLEKGDEIGYFSFGSTVVLLFEKEIFMPDNRLKGQSVQMGHKIGVFLQN